MDAMTTAITTLTGVGAGLLVLAGLAKLPRPDGAMATLHRLHLPSGRTAARVLGAGEVLIGAGVVLVGGLPAAAALVLLYGAFAAIAAWQRSRQLSCGCFGTSDTAVTGLHVATNVVFAVAGAAGLRWAPAAAGDVVADAGALAAAGGALLLLVAPTLLRALLLTAAERQVRQRPLRPAPAPGRAA